jgi:hypothetical protein
MSEARSPRRVLHLVVEGFPPDRLAELAASGDETNFITEIFQLSDSSAGEALEKIFAADTVAVWGKV